MVTKAEVIKMLKTRKCKYCNNATVDFRALCWTCNLDKHEITQEDCCDRFERT